MNNDSTNKGLSIQELEERHELTIAFGGETLEADKERCNDNTLEVEASL